MTAFSLLGANCSFKNLKKRMKIMGARQCSALYFWSPSLFSNTASVPSTVNSNTCNCYQTPAQEGRACKGNLSVNIKRQSRNGNLISVRGPMSDHKQTIDICNISPSYHRPPSHEEQGQQKRSEWDGDPKITIPSTNDNQPPLLS